MRNKATLTNIDNSDPTNYPNGRIQNNTGAGNGTPVNEFTKGDIHEFFDKAMRLYGLTHNNLPDNTTNGYQTIEAVKALASKNDYLLSLTDVSGVINVGVKLGFLQNNESFITKATFDKGSQTTIKGSDSTTKTVTFVGEFLSGEYVRMINTASAVILVRVCDAFNFDVIATELEYLKAATGAEVIAGIIDNKAVTPESFLEAFAEYVIGSESDNFLATILRNGLYPKEHFEIVANLGADKERNYGTFSPPSIGSSTPIGTTAPVSGNLVSATVLDNVNDGEIYRIVFANEMDDTNYQVNISIESLGDLDDDNNLQEFVWKKVSTTQFDIILEQNSVGPDNLKIHVEIIQR